MLGYAEDDVVGTDLLTYLDESAHALVAERFRNRVTDPINLYLRRKDGSLLAAEVRARDMPFQGRLQRVVAVRDLRDLEQARHDLLAEKERLRVTLESIGESVIVTDVSGRVQYLNPVAEALLGGQPCRGQRPAAGRVLPDPRRGRRRGAGPGAILSGPGRGHAVHARPACCGGRTAASSPSSTRPDRFAIEAGRVIGVVLALRDVTEMRKLARQLRYQASHDPLTGLINRSEFELRLQQALASARTDRPASMRCCYHRPRPVQDRQRHLRPRRRRPAAAAGGARCLRRVCATATRWRASAATSSACCSQAARCRAGEAGRAELLRQTIARFPIRVAATAASMSAPASASRRCAADSGSLADVLSAADAACYVAKDLGRNRIHVYQPDDAALARHHGEMEWAQRLSARDQRRTACGCISQPIVPLVTPPTTAGWHEILVRMRRRETASWCRRWRSSRPPSATT
ncbi:MAG: PAS domain S-box protein [Comamonadaceae bacterium]|nr:PAS domain S-box protein [Comamonadaceae bacterium]